MFVLNAKHIFAVVTCVDGTFLSQVFFLFFDEAFRCGCAHPSNCIFALADIKEFDPPC